MLDYGTQKQEEKGGLNEKGLTFGFYRSDVSEKNVKQKESREVDAVEKSGQEAVSNSILATIRETDAVKGHIVEVRHTNNEEAGLGAMLNCCNCCGKGTSTDVASQSGFKSYSFSTMEVSYVLLTGSDTLAGVGGNDRSCCGNFCIKCFPCTYHASQTWCALCCTCCAPHTPLIGKTQNVSLQIGLQNAEKEVIRIEYEPTDFTTNVDWSDSSNCCKPWKKRTTTLDRQMHADGTELRASIWKEEEMAPTCCCYMCMYDCEVNHCGVPAYTSSRVIKEKYIMDNAFKEECEVQNNDMGSFAKILLHLIVHDTKYYNSN